MFSCAARSVSPVPCTVDMTDVAAPLTDPPAGASSEASTVGRPSVLPVLPVTGTGSSSMITISSVSPDVNSWGSAPASVCIPDPVVSPSSASAPVCIPASAASPAGASVPARVPSAVPSFVSVSTPVCVPAVSSSSGICISSTS